MKLILLTGFWMLVTGLALGADEKKEAPKKERAAAAKAEPASKGLTAKYATLSKQEKGKLTRLINDGSAEDLAALPGVGPVLARAIREKRPFENALDLLRVKGIGEETIEKIIAAARTPTAKK